MTSETIRLQSTDHPCRGNKRHWFTPKARLGRLVLYPLGKRCVRECGYIKPISPAEYDRLIESGWWTTAVEQDRKGAKARDT